MMWPWKLRWLSVMALCAISICGTLAQVSIGLRAGLSISDWRPNGGNDDVRERYSENCLGLAAAVPLEVRLSEHFALQPEVAYTQKGVTMTSHYFLQVARTTMRSHYLEVQALAKYSIGNGPGRLHLLAGPSFGRGMLIVLRTKPADGNGVAYDAMDYGPGDDDFRMFQVSMVGGAGVTFGSGPTRLFFDFRYVYGLSPLTNDPLFFTDVNGQVIVQEKVNFFDRSFLMQFGYLVELRSRQEKTGPPAPLAPER